LARDHAKHDANVAIELPPDSMRMPGVVLGIVVFKKKSG
jgi:hypothetical protein